jgi:hypothetical protein
MSSFCSHLPTSAISCIEPYGTGLHRAEPALHERHHLEQEQVHDGARRQQHRDDPAEHAQQ